MPTPHNPPAAVRRALRKLGADIHDARRRRRLSQIADISNDPVGQALASAELPKHVHLKRPAESSRDG